MLKFMLQMKVSSISKAAADLVRRQGCKSKIMTVGAYDVDPRLLVVVIQVATDAERDKLKSRPNLIEALKGLPAASGWPADARADVAFEIESQETVDRENEGNWSFRYG